MRAFFSFSESWQDARYAFRSVRKDLGFFVFAISIIGLGIGASTAVFSVMSPLMLRPLPFEEPERLAWVANSASGGMSAVTSRTSNLRDFRQMNRSFEGLTGYNAFFEQGSYNLVGNGEPERLVGVQVVYDFLQVLGVEPLVGRSFVAEEGVWGGPRTAILSHAFWTRRFAGDREIVGRSLLLNDEPYEVVGVLPPSFDFSQVFAPHTRVDFLRTWPISDETDRWGNSLSMIGRLKPDATVASTQADLDRILVALAEADPDRWGLGATVRGMQEQIAGPFRSGLLLLAAASLAVMLIVCVNLSNLLLAKGPSRTQEMAVRSALGAPRDRLVRLLVFESLFLALGGAVVGVALATLATRFVAASTSIDIPLLRSVAVDSSALLYALALAVVAGLGVGIVPAIRAAAGGEAQTMRQAPRGSSVNRRSARLLEGLVIAEVALACMLLVAGGLLLKSFQKVLDVELGFQPAGLVSWTITTARDFDEVSTAAAYFDRMIESVSAIPGVESAGLADAAPLGGNRTWGLRAPGIEYDEGREWLSTFPHIVDRNYMRTMRIPLVAGRHFTAADTTDAEGVIILNQTAAREVYGGEDVLGRQVMAGGDNLLRVVGIVADVRHRSPEQGADREMYLPMTQNDNYLRLDMVVRSRLPEASLAGSVAAALHAVDPTLPTRDHRSFESIVDRAVSPRRFTLVLLGTFAATALLLAALGIYGVLSYSVSQRTPEIGIRMALGESGSSVLGRVVGKTLLLAACGVAIGAVGSFGITRVLASLLYGVQPSDPSTYLGMTTVLLLVSALAGLLPGLRASRTDPTVALRST
ncbi:MAG: ABC transporter permease [Acidobacteriota bacterium]